jgi:hypothetical protein
VLDAGSYAVVVDFFLEENHSKIALCFLLADLSGSYGAICATKVVLGNLQLVELPILDEYSLFALSSNSSLSNGGKGVAEALKARLQSLPVCLRLSTVN